MPGAGLGGRFVMGMPSCKDLYLLRSSGELEHSPWWRRGLAAAHMAMCSHCARLASQLGAGSSALREHLGKPPSDLAALRRRILDRLSG